MDYSTMKSDEKAILLEKGGSDDPPFVVYNIPPQIESQKKCNLNRFKCAVKTF